MTNCVTVGEQEAAEPRPTVQPVRMPTGLLGFESIREYLLVFHPDEAPFGWLQAQDPSGLAFVVVDPFLVLPDYRPDIPPPDVALLGLKGPEDALLLNIVTIHSPQRATVNLKGPIVINRHTWMAKQVVIANAIEYSVQHPLPVTQSAD
ncbi:flagellar assembly protein FliW [Limisphaera sp. VF-2]|jgi:flagellar assembly factor FliW|uniref:flagellar assembly protein FliW n=1 Tax=Limisphaera sp. VF-2 TaxID=3400418 RepID=UPI00177A432F|nr:flagellar assembly protein FliW [Limisphaera sp.]